MISTRRFCAQHSSLEAVQVGRSSPNELTVCWLPEPPLACRADDTALPRRSPRPRLYSRLPRSSAWPSSEMREDGRSRRYLAWHAIAAWNSGRSASRSRSKYTTRWRRQASVSRSFGPYAPDAGGAGSVTAPVDGPVSAGGVGFTSFLHAAMVVQRATARTILPSMAGVGVFISSILYVWTGRWVTALFRLDRSVCRQGQRCFRYGPQAGSLTSPSARTSRWRTRPSAETAYNT